MSDSSHWFVSRLSGCGGSMPRGFRFRSYMLGMVLGLGYQGIWAKALLAMTVPWCITSHLEGVIVSPHPFGTSGENCGTSSLVPMVAPWRHVNIASLLRALPESPWSNSAFNVEWSRVALRSSIPIMELLGFIRCLWGEFLLWRIRVVAVCCWWSWF